MIAATIESSASAIVVTGRRVFAPDQYVVARGTNYDAAADGKRLVMFVPPGEAHVTVVANFEQELARVMGQR